MHILEKSLFSPLGAVLPYSEVKPDDLLVESGFQVICICYTKKISFGSKYKVITYFFKLAMYESEVTLVIHIDF